MYCHVNVSTGSRGTGQSAAAKYDYISRAGKYEAACQDEVVHLESGSMPAFASSDARLYWAAADMHERSNGRLFRSLTAALPNSLDSADRLDLARSFAAHVTAGELPYTLAVHAGESKKEGVADNPHLHLVFSERVNDGVARGAEQWFRRAAPKKGDPASGGARKTERTKPRAWLEETRSAWAGQMNLAFEQAGVSDRVTSESHATQLARAREAGDAAEEVRLLLNPPSLHIGPPAKHNWEDRPGRAPELKPDRYVAAEAAAASAEEVRSAHAPEVAEVAEARSRIAALDARIAALEAEVAAGERRAGLAAREESVRATSAGGQWLDEAHQSVLARPDGRLTPGERERAVETVEDRLRADLAAREESLMATSTGSTLLREEYGEAVAAAAARQSLAKRESVLERIAQRVDDELGAREEALRSVPPGRQHLSAAEQARAIGAAGPPPPAERESVVRAAEQRVREELDRREERVLAATGDDRLLAGAAEELTERGAISGDGGFAERARVIDRAEGRLEADRTELELKEADLRKDAAGEELLRNARGDVLGAADREAQTLADGRAVIDQASAAKARVESLGIGGMDLYHAHLANIDAKWGVDGNAATTRGNQDAALSAAESDVARLGRLRAVLSDEAAAARYREVLGDGPDRFGTATLDRALVAGERKRKELEAAGERRAKLAEREESVRATSAGGQWLDEAHQSVLARAGGRLTPGERERAVETVEGRLRADLAGREASLMATSTGSTLLEEEHGEAVTADAPRQSFAERESVLERVAQRVDEELGAREEALRSIPPGRRHLSAAEQARAGGAAAAPPTPAERESMVRAAEQRVREELDRREERVLAATGDDRLLAEAAEELAARGAVFGDGGIEERALIIDRAEDLLEGERAVLEHEEGNLLKAAGGEELLRNARRDVLGDDDLEAETLVDDRAVIEQAAAAKARVEALGIGGLDLYHAHLADIDPKWGADGNAATTRGSQDAALSAAESDGARLERLRAVLSDKAAAARYREVLDASPGRFDTADLDRALAAGEREREKRAARRAADLDTATAAAQTAAARSKVRLRPAGVRAVYETGETHAAGLAAVERTTKALDAAADQRLPASTVIDAWTANRSAPGGIAAALAAATAAARREAERAEAARQAAIEKRNSRVKQLLADPASADALIEALEAEDPSWRSGTRPACIDRALDVAERDSGRREVATRRHREHEVVLEAEQRFPDTTSTACQFAGGRFDGTTEVGRAGRRVSQDLSDRALVRTHAAEKAEASAPRNLVQRLYEWLRDRLERLFGRSPGPSASAAPGPAVSSERPAEAGRPRPAAFEERYCREWPEHAADIRRPDFEKLAAGALSGNRLFEREEPRSSRWTVVEPGELPAALARPQPAWSDKAVEEVTRRATAWDPDRTEGRQVAEAHLGGYESRLPAEYSHSAEWRAILKRAEEAVRKAQNSWRYKWADRRKDDRKKRELEATAINRACGRDGRRLHEKMMAAREAARPGWEVTVRIRAVQEFIRDEEATRFRQEQARERARERERAADRPPPERKRTRDRGRGLDR